MAITCCFSGNRRSERAGNFGALSLRLATPHSPLAILAIAKKILQAEGKCLRVTGDGWTAIAHSALRALPIAAARMFLQAYLCDYRARGPDYALTRTATPSADARPPPAARPLLGTVPVDPARGGEAAMASVQLSLILEKASRGRAQRAAGPGCALAWVLS